MPAWQPALASPGSSHLRQGQEDPEGGSSPRSLDHIWPLSPNNAKTSTGSGHSFAPILERSLIVEGLARRPPGYHDATPDLLQHRFLDTEGVITNHGDRITVRLKRRAYSPVLRADDLAPTPVPWWGGRTIHYEVD